MTINTLIYKCAQVNAQRETDYLSESTYCFRFLNATFIFMCHLVGFIRCGCNIKYYDCKFHACKQQVHSKFMLRDLFLKISKRVQLLEYKTKISISKLKIKYIGQDSFKSILKEFLLFRTKYRIAYFRKLDDSIISLKLLRYKKEFMSLT